MSTRPLANKLGWGKQRSNSVTSEGPLFMPALFICEDHTRHQHSRRKMCSMKAHHNIEAQNKVNLLNDCV